MWAFRVGRITQQTTQNAKMVPNEAKNTALPSKSQFATQEDGEQGTGEEERTW